ncbi:hypothetical protein CDV31_001853 [Fusarium ambrosium]|uniref:Uncharacterized protein n=1 Tax=Fusarium ambrosium TaxID=131363 RepID=A0A428UYQ1_9HYPO|nr:hypothetical protein CDV31_001853 [Fusarium ambrosium]
MPSQRPYFLSSFLAAFRPQGPSISTSTHQPNKHTRDATTTTTAAAAAAAAAASSATTSTSTAASSSHHHHHHHHHQTTSSSVAIRSPASGPTTTTATSPGTGAAIPIPGSSGRRGSDSSSEGFRDVIGADKFYIGGRTPGGEEKFFKLGVIRRVRSNDGLSLDRLSL